MDNKDSKTGNQDEPLEHEYNDVIPPIEDSSPTSTDQNIDPDQLDLIKPRKSFKSYIWEFLMLFFAVLCGFLAQYKLENIFSSQQEKQYINSYLEDLSMDTMYYSQLLSENAKVIEGLDTLLSYYDEFATGKYSPTFMEFSWAVNGFTMINYTERTIQQLKNSGGLRLIGNQKVANAITVYDGMVRRVIKEEESLIRLFEITSNNYIEILDLKARNELAKKYSNDIKLMANDKSIDLLLTHDKQKLGSLYHYLTIYKLSIEGIRQSVIYLKDVAIDMRLMIKNEYREK